MTTFLEGSAPALPKIFGTSRDVPSSITENFLGASGDAPFRIFRRMNSALRKICQIPCPLPLVPHWLKASGMGRKILKGLHPALSTPHHLCALMHACTPARLHAYCLKPMTWEISEHFCLLLKKRHLAVSNKIVYGAVQLCPQGQTPKPDDGVTPPADEKEQNRCTFQSR
jgi:hypothetical protein